MELESKVEAGIIDFFDESSRLWKSEMMNREVKDYMYGASVERIKEILCKNNGVITDDNDKYDYAANIFMLATMQRLNEMEYIEEDLKVKNDKKQIKT